MKNLCTEEDNESSSESILWGWKEPTSFSGQRGEISRSCSSHNATQQHLSFTMSSQGYGFGIRGSSSSEDKITQLFFFFFFLGARLKSSGPLISPTSHHTGRQMCFRQLPFFFFLKLLTTTNAVRSLISTDCGGLARATKWAFTGDLLTSMTQANGKGYKECVTQMDSLDPPCIVVLTVM